MRIIENSRLVRFLSFFSPIRIQAITLGQRIYFRHLAHEPTLTHEKIHAAQWAECPYLGFLVLYAWYWIKYFGLTLDAQGAYHNIPFEREARAHQNNPRYLDLRKPRAWEHYRKPPII